jgi:preprotein translocase subunit SecE
MKKQTKEKLISVLIVLFFMGLLTLASFYLVQAMGK